MSHQLPGLGLEDGNEAARPDIPLIFVALLRRQLTRGVLIGEHVDPPLKLRVGAKLD
jgi:hypothetical protein